MFKLFKRVSTIVGSEFNAMLDKAEDPVKMLDQFLKDMESDIREVESAVAKQVANEKMLKRKADDTQAKVEKRQTQAEQAIDAGNDDLAKRALADKTEHEKQSELLQESWDQATKDSHDLQKKLDDMKNEYQQMTLKKDALQARAESAKTRTKMNRTMSAIGSDESKKGFERMEEKVLQYEAEADSSEDMTHESRSLDDEFDKLDNEQNVDDELADLKKKMEKE